MNKRILAFSLCIVLAAMLLGWGLGRYYNPKPKEPPVKPMLAAIVDYSRRYHYVTVERHTFERNGKTWEQFTIMASSKESEIAEESCAFTEELRSEP